jgi:hypothetical protein
VRGNTHSRSLEGEGGGGRYGGGGARDVAVQVYGEGDAAVTVLPDTDISFAGGRIYRHHGLAGVGEAHVPALRGRDMRMPQSSNVTIVDPDRAVAIGGDPGAAIGWDYERC